MASAIIPSDGPPTTVSIGGATYYILKLGTTVPTSVLSKDLVERYGITWDNATWVARKAEGAGIQAYPVVWTHRSDVGFLTPALAANIDEVTADSADKPVAELDREETQRLFFNNEEVIVPRVPKADALAPKGYVPPKKVKRVDTDADDENAAEGKKKKKNGGEPAAKKFKTTSGAAGASSSGCSWFMGRLKSTAGAFDESVRWRELLPVAAAAPPKASAAPKPVITAAPKAAPAPKTSKSVLKSGAAAQYKTVPPPALPVKKAPASASKAAKPAASGGQSRGAPSSRGGGGGGDVIFTIRDGNHANNMKQIMAYLGNAGCVPEETRALVKCMFGAAREKPDEMDHVFRKAGLPVSKWSMDGLKTLSQEKRKELRDDFTAARAVFAELLHVPADEMDVDEW